MGSTPIIGTIEVILIMINFADKIKLNKTVRNTFFSEEITPGSIIRFEHIKYSIFTPAQIIGGICEGNTRLECYQCDLKVTMNRGITEVTFLIDKSRNSKYITVSITNESEMHRSHWSITSNMDATTSIVGIGASKVKHSLFTKSEKLTPIKLYTIDEWTDKLSEILGYEYY